MWISFLLILTYLSEGSLSPPPCMELPKNFVFCERNETNCSYCFVSQNVECSGPRIWNTSVYYPRKMKWNSDFKLALIFSTILGFLGIDRFYLGYYGLGLIKMASLGGFGFWWAADIYLLCTGRLKPKDGLGWN